MSKFEDFPSHFPNTKDKRQMTKYQRKYIKHNVFLQSASCPPFFFSLKQDLGQTNAGHLIRVQKEFLNPLLSESKIIVRQYVSIFVNIARWNLCQTDQTADIYICEYCDIILRCNIYICQY